MKIVTHSNTFHADDVFAVAVLLQVYPEASIERTRDSGEIAKADIAVDVGLIYNPEENRFDHHQPGGAGVRDNGVPYAAFGLVWKKFGTKLSGNTAIAKEIDQKLVTPIDAIDNGVSISKPLFNDIKEYNISTIVSTFLPEEGDKNFLDGQFMKAVQFATEILLREIEGSRREAQDMEELSRIARNSSSSVLVLDRFMRGWDVLVDFPGILFVVYPGRKEWGDDKWYIKTVRKNKVGFESKKLLPQPWAGLSGSKLIEASGVQDAEFCHKGRFLAAAWSKEGVLSLAKKALEA